MSAQAAAQTDHIFEEELLDVDASAAILRWMETGRIPEGIDTEYWEHWLDGGRRVPLEVDGAPITTAMLGRWASTGVLR